MGSPRCLVVGERRDGLKPGRLGWTVWEVTHVSKHWVLLASMSLRFILQRWEINDLDWQCQAQLRKIKAMSTES